MGFAFVARPRWGRPMKWLLVLFIVRPNVDMAIPEVIEEPFSSAVQCWSVGFTLKERDPAHVRWFDCKAYPAGAIGYD